MLAQIIRILLYIILCLIVLSCFWQAPEYPCIEMQDAAIIEARLDFLGGDSDFTFDNLVIRKDNKNMRCVFGDFLRGPSFLIGSQTHNVKFPININIQLFLHDTLLQSLDFEMPENSTLTFYDGYECAMMSDSMATSKNIYQEKGRFYKDVQGAISNGIFIDSSRSESACWMMKRMTEDYDLLRCTKVDGGRGRGGKFEVGICTNL